MGDSRALLDAAGLTYPSDLLFLPSLTAYVGQVAALGGGVWTVEVTAKGLLYFPSPYLF